MILPYVNGYLRVVCLMVNKLLNFRTINILGLERLAEDFDTAARTHTTFDRVGTAYHILLF